MRGLVLARYLSGANCCAQQKLCTQHAHTGAEHGWDAQPTSEHAGATMLQELGAALCTEQVPGEWMRQWEGPAAPLEYCRAVAQRCIALQQWAVRAAEGQLWSAQLSLAATLHPGAMLVEYSVCAAATSS